MEYIINDITYKFRSYFNTETGLYVRTGILDDEGKDTGVDPFMASFPHTIDIGVMGHCIHGMRGLCAKAGIGCYQTGQFINKPNMTLEDYESICKQCQKLSTQFALGGRGDPDCHEHFEEILSTTRKYGIVPNYTTSGLLMNDEKAKISKKYCGAVGVSWYRSDYTLKAIDILIKHENKVNVHYVLSKSTIDEAISRLKEDDFPKGINAVIFLLHKPIGEGKNEDVLVASDPRIVEFFKYFTNKHPYKVGLDSCLVPGILNFTANFSYNSVDTCESGRFSCCIESDMIMLPCSFGQDRYYGYDLKKGTILQGWNSDKFNELRDILKKSCPTCNIRSFCLGGCPIKKNIVLCEKKEKK